MKRCKYTNQSDLFGTSEIESIREEIQRLDRDIAKALKSNEYQNAKELTAEQEKLIQKLVDLGEENVQT